MADKNEPEAHRSPEEDLEDNRTERGERKREEDRDYVPVIIKRTDEARRHPDDILENVIEEGLEQLNRPPLSLFLSAITAGLILGFSVMAVGIVHAYLDGSVDPLVVRLLTAMVYPLGFVVCIMSGSELFTEHTATAVYPVLDRRSSPAHLLRLWTLVLLGNLVGAFCISGLLIAVDEVVGATEGYMELGLHAVEYGNLSLLGSAVIAGWLMAQGAWLVMATPPGLTQVVCIYLVTFLIGFGTLHHAIAGSVEVFAAWMVNREEVSMAASLRFIAVAAVGNLVGGSCFVALLNYAHVRRTRILAGGGPPRKR